MRAVALLLHWGADCNAAGRKEATPLLLAAQGGHEGVVRTLLRAGCDASVASDVGAVISAGEASERRQRSV